jgi:hypothetical protein
MLGGGELAQRQRSYKSKELFINVYKIFEVSQSRISTAIGRALAIGPASESLCLTGE